MGLKQTASLSSALQVVVGPFRGRATGLCRHGPQVHHARQGCHHGSCGPVHVEDGPGLRASSTAPGAAPLDPAEQDPVDEMTGTAVLKLPKDRDENGNQLYFPLGENGEYTDRSRVQ